MIEKLRGETIQLPLPRYAHRDVMERFGSDKPDLRFGMELVDIGDIAAAVRLRRLQERRRQAAAACAA